MSEFGAELTRLMTERGTGVRELARLVPCNPGHISNLRSGKARPSPELAGILDDLLGAGGTPAALAAANGPAVPRGGVRPIELTRLSAASHPRACTVELL